ncbi:MAG: nitroreductase family protein [Acidimicrobiales bacterium]
METMHAIRTRRAVRSFDPNPPTKEQIETVIGAASYAPSDLNRQPWSFLVIQGSDKLADLEQQVQASWLGTGDRRVAIAHDSEVSASIRELIDSGFAMFHGASTAIVLLAPDGDEMAYLDTSLAAQNLMLAAHDIGLATCPVALTHPYFDHSGTKSEFAIPDRLRVVLAIVIGTQANADRSKPARKDPSIYWR